MLRWTIRRRRGKHKKKVEMNNQKEDEKAHV